MILEGRLRAALAKINPTVPSDAIDNAVKPLVRRYRYLPDKDANVVEADLKQAAELCRDRAAA